MLRSPVPRAANTYFLAVPTIPATGKQLNLWGIHVSSTYAQDRWLMVFAGVTVPVNGATPIMAPIFVGNAAKNVSLEMPGGGVPIFGDGVVLICSSTPTTLTIDNAATWTMSPYVEDVAGSEGTVPPGGTPAGQTKVGDLSTGIMTRTVWLDTNGPKTLKKFIAKNLTAAVRYAVVYAVDAPGATSRIIFSQVLQANETKEVDFAYGISPIETDSTGAKHDACVIDCQPDQTPGNRVVANDFALEAYFI